MAPDPRTGDASQVVNRQRGSGAHHERPEAIKAVPLRHWGRWIASVVILYIFVALIYSLAKNPAIHWDTIGDYLFRPLILRGRPPDPGAHVHRHGHRHHRRDDPRRDAAVQQLRAFLDLSWLYIWFFRGTPVFVQILIWGYFGILYPKLFLGLPFTGLAFGDMETNRVIGGFVAAILALGLNEAAYAAELVRAGIISVDRGQNEAAQSLGMSPGLTMRRIVLPQAMRVIIPPMGNETISMLKTTSLVAVISGRELLTNVQTIYSQNFKIMPLLLVACIWYIFFTTLLTIGQYYLERHFGKGFGTRRPSRRRSERSSDCEQKGGDVNEPGNF